MINLNNYEKYFIDYLDNRLTNEEIAELMSFLDANPQLKNDFDSLLNAPVLSIVDDRCIFEHKEKLKKPVYSKQQIYQALVNELEGEIDNRDRQILSSIPADLVEIERGWFKKTKLIPDKEIVFEKKYKLYKQVKIRRLTYYYVSGIAAAILFVLGFVFWKFEFNGNNLGSNPMVHDLGRKKEAFRVQVIKDKSRSGIVAKSPGRFSKLKSVGYVSNNDSAVAERVILSSPKENLDVVNLVELGQKSEMGSFDESLLVAQEKDSTAGNEVIIAELELVNGAPTKGITGKLPERAARHRWMNFLSLVANGIERITGKKVEAKILEKDCITRYQLKVGTIELEQVVACK